MMTAALIGNIRNTLKRPYPFRGIVSRQSSWSAAALNTNHSSTFQRLPSIDLEKEKEPLKSKKKTTADRLIGLNNDVEPFSHDPLAVLSWTMKAFEGKVAMSTSFGIQSAVLLHLATQIKPDIPVVWVDTGYLPKETYEYAETLKQTLNLNLTVKTNSEWSPARMEAVYGKLWEKEDGESHALYGRMRKSEPLNEGLDQLDPNPVALLSGLRASQTKARANMKTVGFQNGRYKILPMLKMTDQQVNEYMDRYDLPHHPLESKGYVTVGDWHSSRPVEEGEDARNTRFGGKFQECGLHVTEEDFKAEEELKANTLASEDIPSFSATHVEALKKTAVHPETELAVIMVKKIQEDGSLCRKCNDVQSKMEKDGVTDLVGYTSYADMREMQSEGVKLAKHFEVVTAPFFLVRSKKDIAEGKDWSVVRSYLQLKKMLETAQEKKMYNSSQL